MKPFHHLFSASLELVRSAMRENDYRGFFESEKEPEKEGLKKRAKEVARSYSLILALLALILVFLGVWATFAFVDGDERFRGEVIV